MTRHRRCAIPHAGVPRGRCQWCGDEIRYPGDHKRAGEDNTRKNWHQDCLSEYFLHSRSDVQLRRVLERDGPRCRACGADTEEIVGYGPDDRYGKGHRFSELSFWDRPGRWFIRDDLAVTASWGYWGTEQRGTRERRIILVCPVKPRQRGADLDHVTPLWSVADLSELERRPYLGPGNLQVLCRDCHKAKTAREASTRAQSRPSRRAAA